MLNQLKMRFTIWSGLLFFILGFPLMACAQGGKAYENVYYRANSICGRFTLTYGDGYIGASQIILKPAKDKGKVIFMPDYGVPEKNGDFRFHDEIDKNGKMKLYNSSTPDGFRTDRSIVLKSINEELSAPDQIKGICYLQEHSYPLLFKKVNRK